MRYPCLHCEHLNEVWEGVDPGSAPSSHAAALLAPKLPWIGPSFLLLNQSLIQAMSQYFHYKWKIWGKK